jgi:hypothetical protein
MKPSNHTLNLHKLANFPWLSPTKKPELRILSLTALVIPGILLHSHTKKNTVILLKHIYWTMHINSHGPDPIEKKSLYSCVMYSVYIATAWKRVDQIHYIIIVYKLTILNNEATNTIHYIYHNSFRILHRRAIQKVISVYFRKQI